MSIGRKSWSALSSLTRQWTVEDEEEVERERRRKIRSHGSSAEEDDTPVGVLAPVEAPSSAQESHSALEQAQLDFVEMLRMRDEKRRRRQEEVLRQQREEEEAQRGTGELGMETGQPKEKEKEKEKENKEQQGQRQNQDMTPKEVVTSAITKGSERNGRAEPEQEEQTETPTKASRKFVSSFSISFNKDQKSPTGGSSTVSSPLSPTGSFRAASPEQVPAEVKQNGDTQASPLASPSEVPDDKEQTPFKRQNYRAWSFRVMRKKEEQSVPFQRSASFRNSSNNVENNTTPSNEDDQQSPFKRNARQRLSSRSIQETMEKLALAAQKSESVKSPTTPRGSLYMADEVSRKREMFEKEQASGESEKDSQRSSSKSQDSGIRWTSALGSFNLYRSSIASKRQLWEKRAETSTASNKPHK